MCLFIQFTWAVKGMRCVEIEEGSKQQREGNERETERERQRENKGVCGSYWSLHAWLEG